MELDSVAKIALALQGFSPDLHDNFLWILNSRRLLQNRVELLEEENHSLKTRTGHYKAERNRMAKELGIVASRNAVLEEITSRVFGVTHQQTVSEYVAKTDVELRRLEAKLKTAEEALEELDHDSACHIHLSGIPNTNYTCNCNKLITDEALAAIRSPESK